MPAPSAALDHIHLTLPDVKGAIKRVRRPRGPEHPIVWLFVAGLVINTVRVVVDGWSVLAVARIVMDVLAIRYFWRPFGREVEFGVAVALALTVFTLDVVKFLS